MIKKEIIELKFKEFLEDEKKWEMIDGLNNTERNNTDSCLDFWFIKKSGNFGFYINGNPQLDLKYNSYKNKILFSKIVYGEFKNNEEIKKKLIKDLDRILDRLNGVGLSKNELKIEFYKWFNNSKTWEFLNKIREINKDNDNDNSYFGFWMSKYGNFETFLNIDENSKKQGDKTIYLIIKQQEEFKTIKKQVEKSFLKFFEEN